MSKQVKRTTPEEKIKKIEEDIEKKLPSLEVDKPSRKFAIDVAKLKRLAAKIREFEEASGATPFARP